MNEDYKPQVLKPKKVFKRCCAPLGDRFYYTAKLSIDPVTGEKIAERGDKIDLDATIQSYVASCDISVIVERAKNGDESVLNVRKGFEGDVALLPKNINDIVGNDGLFEKARANFDKMPADIKALFNNDASEFFTSVLENKVDSVLATYKPAQKVEEIKEEGDK